LSTWNCGSGFPIVKGTLSIGSEADMTALGIPKHNRVLLPMQKWPNILFIWPVTKVACDHQGFCDAGLGESGLAFHGLRAQDIGTYRLRWEANPLCEGESTPAI
jgi:hypothetical protein